MYRSLRPASIESYSLTLIATDGTQKPVGLDGAPSYHLFHDWTQARDAVAAAVDRLGIENVHAVACTMTQAIGGKLTDFSASCGYTKDEVRDMCDLARHHDQPTAGAASLSR